MDRSQNINVYVNPLKFLELDEPLASLRNVPLTHEAVVHYLCPDAPSDLGSIAARYREVSQEQGLFAAPAEFRLLWRFIWPLRHAKGAYMLGDYLGTIALCGMIAEMVTILLFEIEPPTTTATAIKRFEHLRQVDRVATLAKSGIVDSAAVARFDSIRLARNRYLHALSADSSDIERDARLLFLETAAVVQVALGVTIQEGGTLGLNPKLLAHLKQRGFLGADDAG
jgi:hypothetical protein